MIKTVSELIERVQLDSESWEPHVRPWFRGESGAGPALCPKIAKYNVHHENYVLQTFRRQAGGFANIPSRSDNDLWLFLAQHYGVPTRLLDWTEGALHALYFAINQGKENPRVYMLNPRKLNELAGVITNPLNYPLSWSPKRDEEIELPARLPALYIAFAWGNRGAKLDIPEGVNTRIPVAIPATYQDNRMIAQRSCFTIHGLKLDPMLELLSGDFNNYLIEYTIDLSMKDALLRVLSTLGISASTIFPDLDHLAIDLHYEISEDFKRTGRTRDPHD